MENKTCSTFITKQKDRRDAITPLVADGLKVVSILVKHRFFAFAGSAPEFILSQSNQAFCCHCQSPVSAADKRSIAARGGAPQGARGNVPAGTQQHSVQAAVSSRFRHSV